MISGGPSTRYRWTDDTITCDLHQGPAPGTCSRDLLQGSMMHTEVGGLEILPVIIDGNVFATGGRFVHMDAHLSRGGVEVRVATCPVHEARSDVTTRKHPRKDHPGGMVGAMAKRSKTGRSVDSIRTNDLPTYPVGGDRMLVVLP